LNSLSRGLQKKSGPLPERGADRERERAPNRRLRAFLREFGARLCYWGQPRPPSTLLWLSVSLRIPIPPATLARSRFLSFSLPLSAPSLRTPRPANFIPTRAPSVTILPYFPCTLRRSSFFRPRCRSPSLPLPPSLSLLCFSSFLHPTGSLFRLCHPCYVSLPPISCLASFLLRSRSFITTPFPP